MKGLIANMVGTPSLALWRYWKGFEGSESIEAHPHVITDTVLFPIYIWIYDYIHSQYSPTSSLLSQVYRACYVHQFSESLFVHQAMLLSTVRLTLLRKVYFSLYIILVSLQSPFFCYWSNYLYQHSLWKSFRCTQYSLK